MRSSLVIAVLAAIGLCRGGLLQAESPEPGIPFDHAVTVRFAGEPEYPVNVIIRGAYLGPITHSFLVPDEAPLAIHCELPPGDYLMESILTRPSELYWDSTPSHFSIRDDDFREHFPLPQEFFHRYKIEILSPKDDFVAGPNPLLLSWKPIPGAVQYRLYWTEKRAPEKRSERDGSLEMETPFFDFDLELTPGARYEWQVDAYDADQRSIGYWGPSFFFANAQAREAFLHPPERLDRGGYLGVMIAETTHPLPGIRVSQVMPGTPAALAGIQPGDVFTKFAGIPVAELSITSFIAIARSQPPGAVIEAEFARGFSDPEILKAVIPMGKRPDLLK